MSEQVQIAVDSTLCHDAEPIFRNAGYSATDAVEAFLQEVVHAGRMPHFYSPNEETLAAMREIEEGGLPEAKSVPEFMRMLNED